MIAPRVFGMGACRLSGPLSEGIKRGIFGRTTIARGGPTPGTYSFGEMFQLLDVLAGTCSVPAEHRDLCGYREGYEPARGAPGLTGADVCLIEPNGVVDIEWQGLKLNRAQVQGQIINPLKAIDKEAGKVGNRWYNKGLLAANAHVQDEAATALDALIPADFADRQRIVDVLRNARAIERDMAADLAALVARIPIPVGLVAYAFGYLPDGRPMFWPANLNITLTAAAQKLGLPLLEPWRLVEQHGAEAALKEDLRHYRDDFVPVVADLIAGFATSLTGQIAAT